jgi:hypothetical protein
MKKLFATAVLIMLALGIVALVAATPADAAKGTCANVRCAACPDGYHLLLKWPNCCQCVAN